jgi:nucleoid DNA-binding protein
MTKAELKTKPTAESVADFLNRISDEERRADCFAVAKMMQEITGEKPKMWGTSIVGFGSFHFKYASGREGDWLVTGFSPRKKDLTLYLMMGFEQHGELMKQLGKHSTGKSCLYIKRLSDIHVPTLKKLIKVSVKQLKDYAASQRK